MMPVWVHQDEMLGVSSKRDAIADLNFLHCICYSLHTASSEIITLSKGFANAQARKVSELSDNVTSAWALRFACNKSNSVDKCSKEHKLAIVCQNALSARPGQPRNRF